MTPSLSVVRAVTELDGRRNEGFPVVLRGTPHCQEPFAEHTLLFGKHSVERMGDAVKDREEFCQHPGVGSV